MKLTQEFIDKEAKWLLSYAKKKPIKNYGGNYWGFSRTRCTRIEPELIEALVAQGLATRQGNSQFTMTSKT
jgi:hypothetical protein